MKACMLTAVRELSVRHVPEPDVSRPGDVKVRMQAVGICGSDVHYYLTGRIGSQVVDFPFALGHEGAGFVVETGSDVKGLKPGDPVAVEPAMSCGTCDQCRCGRPHTCRKLRFLGCPKQAEGCLSEYIVMPAECCFPYPATLTAEEAALSEPLAIGLYAVRQSVPMKNATLGVLGAGPIGLSVLVSALRDGAKKVFVTDKIESRLRMAKKLGAFWTGNPDSCDVVSDITESEPLLLDAVFECCGQQDAAFQAVDLLKPGGKLMIVGIPPELEHWRFPVDTLRHREIVIQNVRRQCHTVQPALDMLAEKTSGLEGIITHRYPLDQCPEAFDLAADYRDGLIKAMVACPMPRG